MSDSDDPRDDMFYDEDDEEYSDLGIEWEDAKEMGYEDDRDIDDDRFKNPSSSQESYGGQSAGQGCMVVFGLLGAAITLAWAGVKYFS
mgnify:CR=1 FL=1